jgi:hypothetical protein
VGTFTQEKGDNSFMTDPEKLADRLIQEFFHSKMWNLGFTTNVHFDEQLRGFLKSLLLLHHLEIINDINAEIEWRKNAKR